MLPYLLAVAGGYLIGSANKNREVFADGGMMAKGGNIPSIEKRVAEVNKLIKEGNEKGLEVFDSTEKWQSQKKYQSLKYSNGILYIKYEWLDKYNKVKEWIAMTDIILKSGTGIDDQREALTHIASMYRSAINHFDKYCKKKG